MAEAVGRRRQVFGALADEIFRPLLLGLVDQFSIYTDCQPYARLRFCDALLRDGAVRSYCILRVQDRRGPLRMRDAMRYWRPSDGDRIDSFVQEQNGRRWRFLDRWLGGFMTPLFQRMGDALVTYYRRKPYAQLTAGICRLAEGVDATHVVVELDVRERPRQHVEQARRYQVQ